MSDPKIEEIARAIETQLESDGVRLVKDAAAAPDFRLIGLREGGAAISLNQLARAAYEVMAGGAALPMSDEAKTDKLRREIALFFDIDPDDPRCPEWTGELAQKVATALSSERDLLREVLSKIVRLGIDARKYSLADEMLKVARSALTGVTGG